MSKQLMDIIDFDIASVVDGLREMYEERGLSIDKVYEIVKAYDPSKEVSRSTIAKVFRKNGDKDFKWEASLRPICNALLHMDDFEKKDAPETKVYKSVLKLKKDSYDNLKKDVAHYQEIIELLNQQIQFKDERIDKLLATNERQAITNERLTEKLLSCPNQYGECKG